VRVSGQDLGDSEPSSPTDSDHLILVYGLWGTMKLDEVYFRAYEDGVGMLRFAYHASFVGNEIQDTSFRW
jgi:hypothetical protein